MKELKRPFIVQNQASLSSIELSANQYKKKRNKGIETQMKVSSVWDEGFTESFKEEVILRENSRRICAICRDLIFPPGVQPENKPGGALKNKIQSLKLG